MVSRMKKREEFCRSMGWGSCRRNGAPARTHQAQKLRSSGRTTGFLSRTAPATYRATSTVLWMG